MRKLSIALCAFLFAFGGPAAHGRDDFMVGVDANYSLDMEKHGARWKWNGKEQELFAGMRGQGVRWLRVRLWTSNDGVNGKTYAADVIRRARKANLNPYLTIFLSEDWADLMKQPAPAMWKDLPIEKRAESVHDYSRAVVSELRSAGLTSHVYEVGNEIDYGICGVFAKRGRQVQNLREHIWPETAEIIRACEAGVSEVDPEAKFLLHIAHWWDADFCAAFFQFMTEHQVRFDYAGLSYFPSSKIGNSLTFDQFGAVAERVTSATDRPVVICETGYPSTTDFGGQFGTWRNEVPGYPLTEDGQQRWLVDFLKFCSANPKIAGVFYWSPEWYGEGMWKAFALFDVSGEAKPAWSAFH